MNDKVISKSTVEKDLGVHISLDLEASTHVAKVAAKASRRLRVYKRSFIYIDRDILCSLNLTLVHLILDYGTQSWSPYLVRDIKLLEQVQH